MFHIFMYHYTADRRGFVDNILFISTLLCENKELIINYSEAL